MISSKTQIRLIAFAFVVAMSGAAMGQDSGNTASRPQSESSTTQKQPESNGQQLKVEGNVVKTNANSFTLRKTDGTETEVVVTEKTSIRISRKGLFRRDKTADASNILRGLRLKANGRTNSDGQLVAKSIDIDEQDLRTAQALESSVEPVETVATSAQNLAENNSQRIDVNDKRLDQAEQNAQRLSGQVEELSSVANAAVSAAQKA